MCFDNEKISGRGKTQGVTEMAIKKEQVKKKQMVVIEPLNVEYINIKLEGISPLVLNCFSDEAKKKVDDTAQGKRAGRQIDDHETEYHRAFYRDPSRPGINVLPGFIFKACLESCADKSKGFTKVLIRQAVFVEDNYVEIIGKPEMFEYPVRVPAGGAAVIRHRPRFQKWSVVFTVSYNADQITPQLLVNLFNQAGYGIGVCEGRPGKTALNWGRFKVVSDTKKTKGK
jgi:hypothetical protein